MILPVVSVIQSDFHHQAIKRCGQNVVNQDRGLGESNHLWWLGFEEVKAATSLPHPHFHPHPHPMGMSLHAVVRMRCVQTLFIAFMCQLSTIQLKDVEGSKIWLGDLQSYFLVILSYLFESPP